VGPHRGGRPARCRADPARALPTARLAPSRRQGTDGTGQAILPQVPALTRAGFDVRSLYIPPQDRSGWDKLQVGCRRGAGVRGGAGQEGKRHGTAVTTGRDGSGRARPTQPIPYLPPPAPHPRPKTQSQVLYLLQSALASRPPGLRRATVVAESFGGCLGLRLARAAPQLVSDLVLLNPATCFGGSLGGLSSLVTATNLLALFPRDLYTTAQTVMMPLLVGGAGGTGGRRAYRASEGAEPSAWHRCSDARALLARWLRLTPPPPPPAHPLQKVDQDRVCAAGAESLRRMILMEPPPDFDDTPWAQSGSPGSDADDAWGDGGAALWGGPRARGAGPAGAAAGPRAPPGPQFGAQSGPGLFAPAAAANFRANLLREGNLSDDQLRAVSVPTLVVSSARDRMLPSIAEGAGGRARAGKGKCGARPPCCRKARVLGICLLQSAKPWRA
jgi:pimeloyl-ACP methyl ester carboxylesterase